MFCNQCGTKLKDGAHYCANCGARAGEETEGFLKPQLPEKEALKLQSKEDKKKRKKVVVAALLALSVIAVLTGVILMFFSPERRLARALDLGNKYLLEQDYEQAIVAFEKAIGIDPKCEDAYRGLADVYVGMDDYEAAIDILEQGIDQTDSRALSAHLKKMKKTYARIQEETAKRDAEAAGQDMNTVEQTPEAPAEEAEAAAELVPEAPVEEAEAAAEQTPEAPAEEAPAEPVAAQEEVQLSVEATEELERFLFQFWWGHRGNYDCTSGQNGNLLKMIVGHPSCYIPSYYPYNTGTTSWDSKDPLGRWESYASVSETQVDWVLKNIFNCPEAEITDMKASLLSERDDGRYYLDGYYYYALAGAGGPQTMQIESIKKNGEKYQVIWSLHYGNDAPAEKFYSAVVSRKIIDGKAYWSLYSQFET